MAVSTAGLGAARAIPVLWDPEQPGLRNRLAALLALPEPASRQPSERFVNVGELTPGGGCLSHQLTRLVAGGMTPRILSRRSGRLVRLRRSLGVVEGHG
jgi:hypothetical protein